MIHSYDITMFDDRCEYGFRVVATDPDDAIWRARCYAISELYADRATLRVRFCRYHHTHPV